MLVSPTHATESNHYPMLLYGNIRDFSLGWYFQSLRADLPECQDPRLDWFVFLIWNHLLIQVLSIWVPCICQGEGDKWWCHFHGCDVINMMMSIYGHQGEPETAQQLLGSTRLDRRSIIVTNCVIKLQMWCGDGMIRKWIFFCEKTCASLFCLFNFSLVYSVECVADCQSDTCAIVHIKMEFSIICAQSTSIKSKQIKL